MSDDVKYRHIAYGLRRDGTIGPATDDNPVLDRVEWRYIDPPVLRWSDGTTTNDMARPKEPA